MKMKPTTRPPTPRRAPRRMLRPLHARAAAREEEIDDYEGGVEPNMKFSHALIVVLVLHILAVGGVFAFNTLKTSRPAADKRKTPVVEKQELRSATTSETAEKATEPLTKSEMKPPASAIPAATGLTHTVVAGDTLTKIATQHKSSVAAIEQANGLEATATIHVGQVLKIPSKLVQETKTAPDKENPPVSKKAEEKTAAKPAVSGKLPAPAETTKVASSVSAPQTAKPVASPVAQEAKPSAPAETKTESSGKTYTVAKGDNPYSIAKKLKVSYNELLKINKIEDPTKLQIGQKLTIP